MLKLLMCYIANESSLSCARNTGFCYLLSKAYGILMDPSSCGVYFMFCNRVPFISNATYFLLSHLLFFSLGASILFCNHTFS